MTKQQMTLDEAEEIIHLIEIGKGNTVSKEDYQTALYIVTNAYKNLSNDKYAE